MKIILKKLGDNLSAWALGIFFVVDLFNPVFKKYDYGAEYPILLSFGVLLLILAAIEYKRARECVSIEKIFLLLFGLFTILSFTFSQTKNIGFSEVLAFLSMTILYLIYANQKIDWKEKFLRIIKISTILAVIIGFVLYFSLEEVRMFGPFFNVLKNGNNWPNAFALFLLMTWPLLLLRSGSPTRRETIWRNVAIIITIAALFLTFSRGAALVFGFQLVLLGAYFSRKAKKRHILASFGMMLAISISIFFAANYVRSFDHKVIDVEQRVTFGNNDGITSKQERIDFWSGAVKLALEKPIFGWGPFSFRYAYNPIQKTFLANSDHPHNIFLKIAVENGIPAMACFIAFLITIFVTVIKRYKILDQKSKDLVFILGLAVIGGIAHSMIDYNFNFFTNLLLLFVYLIFIRSAVVKNTDETKNHSALFFSVIIALISIWEVTFLFQSHFANNAKALDSSLFPRDHFTSTANKQFLSKNFQDAQANIYYETQINSLDSEAWYLKAKMDCDPRYVLHNYEDCEKDVLEALKLNPMNDFKYYVEYFTQVFNGSIGTTDFSKYLDQAIDILNNYCEYVNLNVHFTAYTSNVETAAELIDLLADNSLANPSLFEKKHVIKIGELQVKKVKMLERMKELREQKTF